MPAKSKKSGPCNSCRTRTIGLAIVAALVPLIAAAQAVTPIDGGFCAALGIRCGGGGAVTALGNYIYAVLNILLGFSGVIAFGALLYCGFVYITSRGNDQVIQRAKTCLVYAIVGLFVIGLAGWFVNAILNL